MKKLLMISLLLFVLLSNADAQIRFDVKLGMSPGFHPVSAPVLINRTNQQEFQFNQVQAEPQFYGGLMMHIPLGSPFFLEGGMSYTKSTCLFEVNYTFSSELGLNDQLMRETNSMVLVPVNIGARIGAIEVTSGLAAYKSLSHTSELATLDGFSHQKDAAKLGWQMGARYAFGSTMLGVEYQGALNRVCEGMSVHDQSLEIMNVPGRWVFNIQQRF